MDELHILYRFDCSKPDILSEYAYHLCPSKPLNIKIWKLQRCYKEYVVEVIPFSSLI